MSFSCCIFNQKYFSGTKYAFISKRCFNFYYTIH